MAYTHITPGWEIEMSAHYYPDKKADRVAELIQLPREELTTMEEASVAQEKAIFSKFSEIEAEWRKQAAETIAIRKAREYLRALPVEHTSNQWKVNQFGWNVLSNMVYKMSYAPASRATSPRSGRRWKPSAQTMQGGVLMKKLLHADLTAILGLIPLYQPTEAGSIELDLLKLQQGGAADYLFLARRERSWLFDPPRVYEPGSYENLCWLAFQNRAGWPVLALFLHVEKFVGGRPWGSVTLLDYREAARDAETFSALAGPQRERHLKLMRKRYLQKVQYCSILEVIQYLKTGR